MDFDLLYPGRFVKAGDFAGRDVTYTISAVRLEELESEKGKKGKGIVAFKELTKELVLNRTNGECLKAMFGRETDKWIGHRVTFFPATITDSFTGEPTLAIRVRGSPELAAKKEVSAKIGRKTVRLVLLKTGQPAKTNGAAKKDTPWDKVSFLLFQADKTGVEGAEFLRQVTGKSDRKALTEEDVSKVQDALDVLRAEAGAEEVPPTSDADAPGGEVSHE